MCVGVASHSTVHNDVEICTQAYMYNANLCLREAWIVGGTKILKCASEFLDNIEEYTQFYWYKCQLIFFNYDRVVNLTVPYLRNIQKGLQEVSS